MSIDFSQNDWRVAIFVIDYCWFVYTQWLQCTIDSLKIWLMLDQLMSVIITSLLAETVVDINSKSEYKLAELGIV